MLYSAIIWAFAGIVRELKEAEVQVAEKKAFLFSRQSRRYLSR
jgi:hypothetical protein